MAGPTRRTIMIDGNEAAASVAHRLSEVAFIYPITPSSNMGELADEWAAHNLKNIWGQVPNVVQMQSEAGAIGAVHGALQAGSLATTFTASQGLLLMIPNMFKIAGELTSFCMHVAARCVATHALSIFGDHSDVMACRQTGFAMLSSGSVQEAHDLAAIAHAATLEARVPFVHFFDGFRTSHEVNKVEQLTDDDLRAMIDEKMLAAHRARALTPDNPIIRGTAQNPDTFFQAREACNTYYEAVPAIVQAQMDKFAKLTGRQYKLVEYAGDPNAQRVIVIMGSGGETADETATYLAAKGESVGVIRLRLYRPFPIKQFVDALPKSVKSIAVLDRTKEPGAVGEPLYLDVVSALREAVDQGWMKAADEPRVTGGRYGLSSKEFTPAMVKGVFDDMKSPKAKRHFTIGIVDDITKLSIPYDETFDLEGNDVVRAVFFGLGADGTVGANKNSIKIIGEQTTKNAQGYFVYDSKKSGAMTISHLRFGPRPVKAPYLIRTASFVACHQFAFIEKYDMLDLAAQGATLLLNAPFASEKVWDQLPKQMQQQIIDKKLRVFTIDAASVAAKTGMGGRINSIMQTCFFAISGVLPREQAIDAIKAAIKKTYGKKGEEVVKRNYAAVDATLENLHELTIPATVTAKFERLPMVSDKAPDFVKKVSAVMMEGKGDLLPVSAFPIDGTWPTATTQWEKRNIALEIPTWEPELCIQCNKCAFVCPHAAIRAKAYPANINHSPATFKQVDYKAGDLKGNKFTIQVAPEDCTGCGICVMACPAKDKSNPKRKAINMEPQAPLREAERTNYEYFLNLPEIDRSKIARLDVKGSQFLLPLFEYSGACGGCGETPYVKLMTQLFGDRLLVANATGCSSIYGGNLPTTPYSVDRSGRGPAWCNSLFEDNAEFGLGVHLGVEALKEQATILVKTLSGKIGDTLVAALLSADQTSDAGINEQRARVVELRSKLKGDTTPEGQRLLKLADYLVKKSTWILGGDGWAYDIGYGGLDHLFSMRHKVNILVLDTEVYSNTGGQASKSTPLGAAAKFASSGKAIHKKDLGLMAMSYGHVYVASVALGAKDNHTVQAFIEAENYPGPSLIIAYSHCIAHGYDLKLGLEQQKLAFNSGIWPLFRFDPRLADKQQLPLQLETGSGKVSAKEYMRNETRFRMVEKLDPQRFRDLAETAVDFSAQRLALYQQLAQIRFPVQHDAKNTPAEQAPSTTAEKQEA